jgi:hypothetical protein
MKSQGRSKRGANGRFTKAEPGPVTGTGQSQSAQEEPATPHEAAQPDPPPDPGGKGEPAGSDPDSGPDFRRTSPSDFSDPKGLALIQRALSRGWDVTPDMRKALPIILIRLAAEKTTAPRDVIRAATVLVNMTSVAEAAVANEIRLSEIVSLASEVEALQKRVDGDE